MKARVERSRSVIESRFREAGDVLAMAAEGVGQLITALERVSGALDPATVSATTRELADAADTLRSVPVRHAERRERIRNLSLMATEVRAEIEEMRRNLAYLRVFAINIKVTAAGVEGAGEDFGLFAQEISNRIDAGKIELEAFAAAVLGLHDQLTVAIVDEQALAGQCERLIPAVPDGLNADAAEMAAHHENVSRVTREVAGLARDIQRQVGAALPALQVGDATRQRIEHMQGAIALVARSSLPPALKKKADRVARRLASAQLAAAAEDFHRDATRLNESMGVIASDATEILRLRDLALGRTTAGEGFLERMTAQLGQALELVTRMEAADQAANETGRSAADAAGALNLRIQALQSIKKDVQQMALNTTLKCSRIGELGKPLAVIAIELRGHAAHLETSAQVTLEALQRLAADAGLLVSEADSVAAGAALTDATDRVRKAGETVEADLDALARQSEAVVAALSDAAARLDFRGEIGAILDAAAEALAEEADTEAFGEIEGEIIEILAKIARTYTMSQERAVHAAVVENLGIGAATVAA